MEREEEEREEEAREEAEKQETGIFLSSDMPGVARIRQK